MASRTLGGVAAVTIVWLISACAERALDFTSNAVGVGGQTATGTGGVANAVPSCLGRESLIYSGSLWRRKLEPNTADCHYRLSTGLWPTTAQDSYLTVVTTAGTVRGIYPLADADACDQSPYGGFYYAHEADAATTTDITLCPCTCDALNLNATTVAANVAPLPQVACQGTHLVNFDGIVSAGWVGLSYTPEGAGDCGYSLVQNESGAPINYAMRQVEVVIRSASGFGLQPPHVSDESACASSTTGGWFYDDNATPQRIRLCSCSCSEATSPSVLVVLVGLDAAP